MKPTAAEDSINNPLKALKVALLGPKTEGDMVADIPLNNQREAKFVFEKNVAESLEKIKKEEVKQEQVLYK